MKLFFLLSKLLMLCLIGSPAVFATEVNSSVPNSLCEVVQSEDKQALLWQQAFEDQRFDLAMALTSDQSLDIKRVTFGGASEPACRYKIYALARGGDWGWHIAWVDYGASVLNYARMDGEAWVSSPVKKLSNSLLLKGKLYILSWQQQAWIMWQGTDVQAGNLYAVYSADEGRNWQAAREIATSVVSDSAALGRLQLTIKNSQPYLAGDGLNTHVCLPSW
jgi:hypothetical protein